MDYTKRCLDDSTAVARRPPRRYIVRAAGSIGVGLAAGSEVIFSSHTLALYVFYSEPLNHQGNIQSGASMASAPGGSISRRVVVVRKPPAAVGARAVRGAAGGAGGASHGRYRQFDAPRYIFLWVIS